jgi:hypothetical protein
VVKGVFGWVVAFLAVTLKKVAMGKAQDCFM